jgi:hypothetical protein
LPVRASLVVLLVLVASRLSPLAQSAEYQLKAAFVSKFPEFTEWPESALNGRNSIDLCVTRPNPFGAALAELIEGERLRGRLLRTRTVDEPSDVGTCQLLFISAAPAAARRAMLARAAMLPLLTVGDYPGFLDEGGMVHLRLVDGRVRFDVNVDAAERAGVRLHSQLLRLALSVRGGTR